jgi:threonine dehydratase
VWGIQTEASPSFALSLERSAAVESYEGTATLAEGLEGGIPERAFLRAAGVVAGVAVVSETSLAQAMRFAVKDLGLAIEGSAAVSLVPVLEGSVKDLTSEVDVVCVLTGRNVDPSRLVW